MSVVSRAQPADSNMSKADKITTALGPGLWLCGMDGWLEWDGRRYDEFEAVLGF